MPISKKILVVSLKVMRLIILPLWCLSLSGSVKAQIPQQQMKIGSYNSVRVTVSQETNNTERKLRLMADGILKDAAFLFVDQQNTVRYSSLEKIPKDVHVRPESPYNDWRYWNGVLNISLVKLAKVLHQPLYRDFVRKNVAFGFDSYPYFERQFTDERRPHSEKWNYPFGQFFIMEELDDCGAMGASVIEVYRTNGQTRYHEYLNKAADHILNKQSRLIDGTLVRTFPRKWTLWADDLYMGLSFLSRMGGLTGEQKYYDDAATQVINFHKYLFTDSIGLMSHCWYSDLNRRGIAYWGRANGWALVAQVDLLDHLPIDHPKRDTLTKLLQRHIKGILQYQTAEGMWHQLLDKTDSYLETSCSAMFTYAIARSVNKGYVDESYSSCAFRSWNGVMAKIRPDGQVEGVCAGTATSDNFIDYYTRPTPLNDIHGIGAILLAGAEVLQLSERVHEK